MDTDSRGMRYTTAEDRVRQRQDQADEIEQLRKERDFMAAQVVDLAAKLDTSQAELHGWRSRAGVDAPVWQPIPVDQVFQIMVTDLMADHDRPARSSIPFAFVTPDGERVTVAIPDDVRLCRRSGPPVDVPALVERLLDEAYSSDYMYVVYAGGPSRRRFMRRLREELAIVV